VEGNYLKTLELAPSLAERVRAGTRESRFHGTSDLPGFFRRPYGPGWALVGDAGYTVDPSTAQGLSNALRDAERVAAALDDALTDRRPFAEALAESQRARDAEVAPMYDFTFNLATLEPPPPELVGLLGASAGNTEAMDAWARMFAGVLPVPAFFDPERIAGVMAGAVA
jgi:2-polyprenyl-6-methoxyphenol hydroxylase-like FAD-dependent oxidoreductase